MVCGKLSGAYQRNQNAANVPSTANFGAIDSLKDIKAALSHSDGKDLLEQAVYSKFLDVKTAVPANFRRHFPNRGTPTLLNIVKGYNLSFRDDAARAKMVTGIMCAMDLYVVKRTVRDLGLGTHKYDHVGKAYKVHLDVMVKELKSLEPTPQNTPIAHADAFKDLLAPWLDTDIIITDPNRIEYESTFEVDSLSHRQWTNFSRKRSELGSES